MFLKKASKTEVRLWGGDQGGKNGKERGRGVVPTPSHSGNGNKQGKGTWKCKKNQRRREKGKVGKKPRASKIKTKVSCDHLKTGGAWQEPMFPWWTSNRTMTSKLGIRLNLLGGRVGIGKKKKKKRQNALEKGGGVHPHLMIFG